ncbi:MAG: MAPEG family protein [Gammaproteobacteria bacterium]
MTPELQYTTWVAILTTVMWMPYVLNMIMVRGLLDAVGYPESPKPLTPWAARMKAANDNAVANLAIFAPLVLIAHVAGISNETTILACMVFFWARVIHAVTYTFAVPWLRTAAFVVGFGCQLVLAIQILG